MPPTGVIDESSNFSFEEPEPKVQVTPLEKEAVELTDSKQWPNICQMIKDKQEYWQRYFPGSDYMKNKSHAEKGAWWDSAAIYIADLESIISTLEGVANATKRSQQDIREGRR